MYVAKNKAESRNCQTKGRRGRKKSGRGGGRFGRSCSEHPSQRVRSYNENTVKLSKRMELGVEREPFSEQLNSIPASPGENGSEAPSLIAICHCIHI